MFFSLFKYYAGYSIQKYKNYGIFLLSVVTVIISGMIFLLRKKIVILFLPK
jgi:hypothetical protein